MHVAWIALGATAINVGSLGLGLPYMVASNMRRVEAPMLIASVVGALLVGGGVWASFRCGQLPMPARSRWLRLVVADLVTFAFGYGVFLTTSHIIFTSLGIANRVGIAGAVGVAMSVVGILSWLGRLARHDLVRQRLFATLIAVLCAGCWLVTSAEAQDWAGASRQQRILADIQTCFPDLPASTTFILDGFCPYVGPAVVFERNWDLLGALAILSGEPSIGADVMTLEREWGPLG